jgi:hypothetical protein
LPFKFKIVVDILILTTIHILAVKGIVLGGLVINVLILEVNSTHIGGMRAIGQTEQERKDLLSITHPPQMQ